MSPFFSIIIPTYNRAHLIEETIQSVLQQEYDQFEIIVVDDGSIDKTQAIIEKIIQDHKQKKISYFYKTNGERAVARNYGLNKASGDYIIYFDSDDTLYPNHLKEAAQFIVSNPGVEIFHLRYDIKNSEGQKTGEGPIYSASPNRKLMSGNFLSCNGVVLKKEIALENPFNENRDLSAAEDWELWLRLSVKYPIHYINTITSTICNHDDRSVLAVNKDKLIKRMEVLLNLVNNNVILMQVYGELFKNLRASCYSYISLHLALTKQYRKDSLKYLAKTLMIQPGFIFHKRFFGILKHIL